MSSDIKRVLFDYISSDNEYITKKDLKKFYKIFENVKLKDKQLEDIIVKYDINKDNKISFDEFKNGIKEFDTSKSSQELFYDNVSNKEKDDLDYDKIKTIYKTYHPHNDLVSIDKELSILKCLFDSNNDDKVSKSEFINVLSEILKK